MGDAHCSWGEINKIVNHKKPDIILQCGDFGWWPGHPDLDIAKLKLHNTQLYWCDGNHENHESLKEWNEKLSHEIHSNCFYMPRGRVLTLPDGRNVLFVGGGSSIDKHYRTPGYDWFPEEIITIRDFDKIPDVNIDIVISHTCPTEFFSSLNIAILDNDPSREILSMILHHYKPKQWFFGHFHQWKRGNYNDCNWECLNMATETGWWTMLR